MPLHANTNRVVERMLDVYTHYTTSWDLHFQFVNNTPAVMALVQAVDDWDANPESQRATENDTSIETIARSVVRYVRRRKLTGIPCENEIQNKIKARVLNAIVLPCHIDAFVMGQDVHITMQEALRWVGGTTDVRTPNVLEFIILPEYCKHSVLLESSYAPNSIVKCHAEATKDAIFRTVHKVVLENISMGYAVPLNGNTETPSYVFVEILQLDHWMLEAAGFIIHLHVQDVVCSIDRNSLRYDMMIMYNENEDGSLCVTL
jgi:hypothetical protein